MKFIAISEMVIFIKTTYTPMLLKILKNILLKTHQVQIHLFVTQQRINFNFIIKVLSKKNIHKNFNFPF